MGQLLYSLMTFPPYTHQEYPKEISSGDRKAIVVDAEHEAATRKMWEMKDKRGPGRPRKTP